MTRKKRFGISDALTRGLSETINVVENNAGLFRNVVLPLSRVELDPDNPRKLMLTLDNVRHGIQSNDPDYVTKSNELEKLHELAHTIQSSGLINPIVVYKQGEAYRVVAGERRCLASILAGKQEIDARVFSDKPKSFDLKLLQWVENTAREDLTLHERLDNVREIIKEYQHQYSATVGTPTKLKEITGLSLSQCSYYLAAIHAPSDIQESIKTGELRNLDKAAFLAGIESGLIRERVLKACLDGATLKVMKQLMTQSKDQAKTSLKSKLVKPGRQSTLINMGYTKKPSIVRILVESTLSQPEYALHRPFFQSTNWNDSDEATRAFRQLVILLEKAAK